MNDVTHSWPDFVHNLHADILPIYARHEEEFDFPQIHGRLHICRSLILAECMATLYRPFGAVDPFAIRYAIAFHDSGRQGNGRDIWEPDSAANCYAYLTEQLAVAVPRAEFISQYIVKTDAIADINEQITHDADVLEIMRITGIDYFKPDFLRFGQDVPALATLRDTLIKEAWQLISLTEQLKTRLTPATYLADLLQLAQAYPLLASGLPFGH